MSDLISRKMMKPKTAIRMLKNMETMCIYQDAYGQPVDKDLYEDALDMAIEALQAKTDGDTISRQAAIDAINKINPHGNSDRANALGLAENAIILLPSAEPKTGKWLDDKGRPYKGKPNGSCWCGKCGEWLVASDEYAVSTNFCPNCGVRMLNGGE